MYFGLVVHIQSGHTIGPAVEILSLSGIKPEPQVLPHYMHTEAMVNC